MVRIRSDRSTVTSGCYRRCLCCSLRSQSVLFAGRNLRDANLRTTVRVLTYSENWMTGFPGSLAHLWTLSVEQFYMCGRSRLSLFSGD